jgi:glycosyltransferase involved in cell wall biosynthesis
MDTPPNALFRQSSTTEINQAEMNETICIVPHRPGLGGPASFQSRLIRVLNERGYRISHDLTDPTNFAVLVIGGTKNIRQLRAAQRHGVRILQRLNGMNWVHRKRNTGVKHFLRAEINNNILAIIRKMADGIIYQSNFSREWWERERGAVKAKSVVVYNGVDLADYSPSGPGQKPDDKFRILIVEGNLGGGYEQGLESAAACVKLLIPRLQKSVELMVAGNVPPALIERITRSDVPVIWKGIVRREDIPELDRSAHVLLSTDINAACPNSVIEAMACGLPVVGYDTGALRELVASGAGEIAPYGGDVWQLDKPDIHSLADAAQKVINNQVVYAKQARALAESDFNIQDVADRYLETLLN